MPDLFDIQPIDRFAGESQPVKRPKEFACFSYDDNHEFHLGDSSLRWYYPPQLGTDLSQGFESFDKHDGSQDEHIDSLLKAIIAHEQEVGKKIDSQIVTWRGMMTKIMSSPFEDRDGYVRYNGEPRTGYRLHVCMTTSAAPFDILQADFTLSFIEENHAYKQASMQEQQDRQNAGNRRRNQPQFSPEVMTFWEGYKFETLSTLPATWGETSREYIENRDKETVSNKAQYCSIVRTGLGKSILCLGGEVDATTKPAVMGAKPHRKGAPINWVELKTSAAIQNERGMQNFERKLMKFWIQSFLLGVPNIIVGFRDQGGILRKIEEIRTESIPAKAKQRNVQSWNADMCINFASGFLDWLRQVINDDGVWRIRRAPGSKQIEVTRVEEAGHGKILTDDFINWRIKLSLDEDRKH
ncbi:dhp1-interacting protein [Apiospora kogelbergensis]|uniref:Decapping nuclease n=1 Tax=Apiospora kogelbergensis TaxID=1337665 RepID=A0AAW0QSW1_9PEZI